MSDLSVIQTNDGPTARLFCVEGQGTYSSVLLGTVEKATEVYLEDPTAFFVPEKWRRYPFALLGVSGMEKKLPSVAYTALFVAGNFDSQGHDLVKVVLWFQDSFFEPPSPYIEKSIQALDWTGRNEAKYEYFN